ncbi:lambda-exonuclease family protein [Gordonia sp. (in: high G+C Gram-positive bacteria)]|uniref:lambda-exonuclease family protein n=1 Tax=Gordonia sp. (in: high G+C Gram-positive bacteria) TaxID=84139 RepID=UPI003F9E6CD6
MTGHLLADIREPGSREWLDAMTASKIAAVVGLSKHDTPHSLWHRMAGTTPREPQSRAQTRGHVYEPMIRGWVAELQPQWKVETTGTWQHATESWALASPDGLLHDDDGLLALLEIKTDRNYWQNWRTGVPTYYQAQCQWQMWVTGVGQCVVAACGPDELMDMKPELFTLDADPAVQQWLADEGRLFMDSLELGIEPVADYRREPDRIALRWKHTEIVDDPGVSVPDELAIPFLTALVDYAIADEAKTVATADLAAFLGDSKKASWNGATLGTRKRGRGGGPPSFATAPKLADRAPELLHPTERKAS